jgi:hypothetical protein
MNFAHARRLGAVVSLAAAAAGLTACGSSSSTSSTAAKKPSSAPAASPAPAGSGAPVQAGSDATSAATGDIPDNQAFLTFHDPRLGIALRYPEGWTQLRTATGVSFRDKGNQVRAQVTRGAAPTVASVRAELARRSGVTTQSVTTAVLPAGAVVKAHYVVRGAADPVTGRRPILLVDRYVYTHAGKVATLDLATPRGVDNIDAYRMISRSFAWR